MLKETNLSEVKEVFKTLAYAVPINPEICGLCNHPFTNMTIVPDIKSINNSPNKMLDLTKENDYKIWIEHLFNILDNTKDVFSLFYIINKPYKLTAFKYSKDYLSKKDFSELLEYCWTISENPNGDINVSIRELISYLKKADKHILMNDKEYDVWNNLPDELVVYRGISDNHNPKGLSWTNNIDVAEWFMNRWKSPDNYMLKATVKKEDCLCYFNGRNEEEIVVDSRHIKPKRIDYIG